jgi:hypothetical protein
MRRAYNDVSIVRNGEKNNELIGVSLGYDFCAEHEWGIKGIKSNFGITVEKKIGIDARSITKGSVIFKEKGKLGLIRTGDSWSAKYHKLDERSFDECVPHDLKHLREDQDVHTAWCEDDFCVIGPVDDIREIAHAFEKKNICFATINDMPAFGGTSLCILIKDRVPQEVAETLTYVDTKARDLSKYEEKIGIAKLKEKKYKSAYSNDFDVNKHKYWMALSPRWMNYKNENPEHNEKNNTKFDIMYWVNYGDNETYGWFTVEQIKEWLETPSLRLSSFRK